MAKSGDAAVVAARLTAQLLAGRRVRSPEAVAERLLAIQAQDARGFRLTVRSRTTGLRAADVDRALTDDRSLVVTWLNRGTLHLVTADDYWWLHPLTTPQLATGNERRLGQEGVSVAQAKRGVDVVTKALQSDGPQTRAQLRRRLDAARVPTARQALVHVIVAASLRGPVVRGPMVGNEQAFVWAPDWIGPAPEPLDRDEALARLARRYLAGHGPATERDLAAWAGLTLGDARRALDAIAAEAVSVGGGRVRLAGTRRSAATPKPRLLGPFDPLLHGWASREPFVGSHAGVVTSNGLFRPVALVGGRVVATWSLAGGIVTLKPLEEIDAGALAALTTDAADVLRFLGLPATPLVVD